MLRKHWFPVALVLLVIGTTLFIWNPFGSKQEELPVIRSAPDFELEATNGQTEKLSASEGKVRLVYYFFSYCPDICIPTTAMLSKLQDELVARELFGEKAVMYSISFDPERDTRERLKEFSEAYQADETAWKFLRGDETYVKDLALKYGISVLKDAEGNFIHQNIFTLVDAQGQIRQYYNAGDPAVVTSGELIGQIADDIERLAN